MTKYGGKGAMVLFFVYSGIFEPCYISLYLFKHQDITDANATIDQSGLVAGVYILKYSDGYITQLLKSLETKLRLEFKLKAVKIQWREITI